MGCVAYRLVHHKGNQGRNLEAELKQSPWRDAVYYFPSPSLISVQPNTTCQDGPTHSGMGHPHQSAVKEESYRHARAI